METFDQFIYELGSSGQLLDRQKIAQFKAYLNEIKRANDTIGLVSKNDLDRMPSRHFMDSLMPVVLDVCSLDGSILDLGSGAGFPGIPLAMILVNSNFYLVEANRRKSTFLRHVIRTLRIKNATVQSCRVEALRGIKSSARYDMVVSRAVSSVEQLTIWASDVLKNHGRLICYKGANPENEISQAALTMKTKGMVLDDICSYNKSDSASPTLVILKKIIVNKNSSSCVSYGPNSPT